MKKGSIFEVKSNFLFYKTLYWQKNISKIIYQMIKLASPQYIKNKLHHVYIIAINYH